MQYGGHGVVMTLALGAWRWCQQQKDPKLSKCRNDGNDGNFIFLFFFQQKFVIRTMGPSCYLQQCPSCYLITIRFVHKINSKYHNMSHHYVIKEHGISHRFRTGDVIGASHEFLFLAPPPWCFIVMLLQLWAIFRDFSFVVNLICTR